jgi:hypothetical protein
MLIEPFAQVTLRSLCGWPIPRVRRTRIALSRIRRAWIASARITGAGITTTRTSRTRMRGIGISRIRLKGVWICRARCHTRITGRRTPRGIGLRPALVLRIRPGLILRTVGTVCRCLAIRRSRAVGGSGTSSRRSRSWCWSVGVLGKSPRCGRTEDHDCRNESRVFNPSRIVCPVQHHSAPSVLQQCDRF